MDASPFFDICVKINIRELLILKYSHFNVVSRLFNVHKTSDSTNSKGINFEEIVI